MANGGESPTEGDRGFRVIQNDGLVNNISEVDVHVVEALRNLAAQRDGISIPKLPDEEIAQQTDTALKVLGLDKEDGSASVPFDEQEARLYDLAPTLPEPWGDNALTKLRQLRLKRINDEKVEGQEPQDTNPSSPA